MKYIKMLGLAAVAAMALTALFASGTASATELCEETVTPCPEAKRVKTLDLSVVAGTPALLVNTSGEELDKCTGGTVKGKVTVNGSSTTTTTGPVEELTWANCTWPTSTLKKGSLEIHAIAGTDNGTVTADGEFQVTINTVFFGSCIYGVTSGVDLGELTGSATTPIFHANAVAEKFSGSAFACPETSKWTATYHVTGTAPLYVV